MMHGAEKSGLVIVAGKPANKAEQPAPEGSAAMLNAAEPVERRAEAKGNASQQSTRRTQSRVSVSQALERIRQTAARPTAERWRSSRCGGAPPPGSIIARVRTFPPKTKPSHHVE